MTGRSVVEYLGFYFRRLEFFEDLQQWSTADFVRFGRSSSTHFARRHYRRLATLSRDGKFTFDRYLNSYFRLHKERWPGDYRGEHSLILGVRR